MLILAPFCHSFGSLWHTLGHLWLPFGSLSVSFGSLLVPLGSLLPTLALHFLTLGASLFHFSYLYAFSMKFSCIFYAHWNSDSCFVCLLSRPFQQSTRRQYQEPELRTLQSLGPREEPCRRQLRSTGVSHTVLSFVFDLFCNQIPRNDIVMS